MNDWLDAELHADRALELYERGRWAEAESELRKAIALNPEQAEWHYNLGLTLEAAGRDLESLGCFERAVALMPDHPEPMIAAGAACARLRRYPQTLAWMDAALRLDATAESAYAHKIDALARLGRHDEAETTFYLAEHALEGPSAHCLSAVAESLIDRGVYERAGWCLREAIRLEPQMGRLRARLAAVLAATGKPQRALQMYLRELRDDPGNIDTLLDYGELLMDMGRLPESAEKFRRVLELEPANVDAHFCLGQIALKSGRLEQANLELELVNNLEPAFPQIHLLLGEVELKRGRKSEARIHLQLELDEWSRSVAESGTTDDDVAELAPADNEGTTVPEGRSAVGLGDRDSTRLARLLLEAGMAKEAATVYGLIVEQAGPTADLLRSLALARFEAGDVEGGMAASRKVLRLDPRSIPAMHNLALAALERGQLNVAAGWIERGLRVDRHDQGLRRLRMRLYIAWMKRWTKQAVVRK